MLTLVLDACGCHKIFPPIGGLKQEKLILSHFWMLTGLLASGGSGHSVAVAADFQSLPLFSPGLFLSLCVCVCVSPLCMSCSWQKDNLCRCLRDQILCKCCHTLLFFFSLLFFIEQYILKSFHLSIENVRLA